MYNEEETADAGESKDDKENLPETMGWAVQLVWQDLQIFEIIKKYKYLYAEISTIDLFPYSIVTLGPSRRANNMVSP